MTIYDGKTGLYGIQSTNRKPNDHWGKNCFNSSFPTSLACYMLENSIPAVYVHLAEDPKKAGSIVLSCRAMQINELFNCGTSKSKQLSFLFESAFEPFKKYAYDDLDNIDLVVAKKYGEQLRPIEIKLTAFPDNSTVDKPKEQWGSELVIRAATTSYCALGMFDSISSRHGRQAIRDCFEANCSSVSDWTNDYEVTHKFASLKSSLDKFEKKFFQEQKPVLMQTLWKTKGKSPYLEDDCFQIIVWSDFAFEHLMKSFYTGEEESMSRYMRATARMIKCLWDLSKSGKVTLKSIYREMTYNVQNDKEFSVPGRRWRQFLEKVDFDHFPIKEEQLKTILDPNFIDRLSPERRLDQTIFFTLKK